MITDRQNRANLKALAFGAMYGGGSRTHITTARAVGSRFVNDGYYHLRVAQGRFVALYGAQAIYSVVGCAIESVEGYSKSLTSDEATLRSGEIQYGAPALAGAGPCPICALVLTIADGNKLDLTDPVQYHRAHHLLQGFK